MAVRDLPRKLTYEDGRLLGMLWWSHCGPRTPIS